MNLELNIVISMPQKLYASQYRNFKNGHQGKAAMDDILKTLENEALLNRYDELERQRAKRGRAVSKEHGEEANDVAAERACIHRLLRFRSGS